MYGSEVRALWISVELMMHDGKRLRWASRHGMGMGMGLNLFVQYRIVSPIFSKICIRRKVLIPVLCDV
jgi:hypothetical protein